MKNLTILLLLFSNLIFGQIPNDVVSVEDKEFNNYFFTKSNIPTATIKLLNFTEEDIDSLKIDYKVATPGIQKKILKTGKFTKEGTFELEVEFALPYQNAWLGIGELFSTSLYLNTDLSIEIDKNLLKSEANLKDINQGVRYLGSDGELNTYLNNHANFEKEKQQELRLSLRKLKRKRKLSVSEFIAELDSIYSMIYELDNQFNKQNPSDYKWMVKSERLSFYYYMVCYKHYGKRISAELFSKVNSHKPYLTGIESNRFYKALFTYSSAQSKKINRLPSDTLVEEKTTYLVAYLDSLYRPSKADLLKIKIHSKEQSKYNKMLKPVINSLQTEWCKYFIQEQNVSGEERLAILNKIFRESNSMASNTSLGLPYEETKFGAKLYIIDSIDAQTLLMKIKNSFEDKSLFLDFWATWCVHCIGKMPYSQALHKEMENSPIEFIYLCTSSDSSKELWKSKIEKLELSGTHLFVEKSIEREVMNLFSVTGFPSYVFLSSKGEYKPKQVGDISTLKKEELLELMEE